jgi:hypothetical protein
MRRGTRRTALVLAATTLAITASTTVHAGAPTSATAATYTGDVMVVAGLGTARLAVVVSSSNPTCVAGRSVTFHTDADQSGTLDPDEYWTTTTAADGAASTSVSGLAAGLSQVVAEVDATANCGSIGLAADLYVSEPGSRASGSGWYDYPSIGRAHLEFSARTRVRASNGGLPPTASVRGNITWRIDRLAKFTGTVTGYTTWCPPQVSTTLGARCGYLGGTGTLWRWGTTGRTKGWVKQPGQVEFTLLVEDGNPVGDDGRRCTIVGPDRVRFYLPGFEFLSKTAGLIPLGKGRIDVT